MTTKTLVMAQHLRLTLTMPVPKTNLTQAKPTTMTMMTVVWRQLCLRRANPKSNVLVAIRKCHHHHRHHHRLCVNENQKDGVCGDLMLCFRSHNLPKKNKINKNVDSIVCVHFLNLFGCCHWTWNRKWLCWRRQRFCVCCLFTWSELKLIYKKKEILFSFSWHQQNKFFKIYI